MQVWAEECRRAQGLEILDPIMLSPEIFLDRERVMQSSGLNHGRLGEHPGYVVLPFTTEEMPPRMLSKNNRAQVFYFSPETLAALKADASPINTTKATKQPWIATNDALSALLWRTMLAVQCPLHTLEGDPVSTFNCSLNGRLRTDPPVHPNALGCFLEFMGVSAPVRTILGSASLADLAVLIRQALNREDGQFPDNFTTLIEQLDDLRRILPFSFFGPQGINCMLSSWIDFKMYELEWGALMGGHIESVRAPHVGVINGLQLVLPSPPEGGMEVMIGVTEECLEKVLNDRLWIKYAVAR